MTNENTLKNEGENEIYSNENKNTTTNKKELAITIT